MNAHLWNWIALTAEFALVVGIIVGLIIALIIQNKGKRDGEKLAQEVFGLPDEEADNRAYAHAFLGN